MLVLSFSYYLSESKGERAVLKQKTETFASVQLIECLFLYFVCMSRLFWSILSWPYIMTMKCLRDYNLRFSFFYAKYCCYSKAVYFIYISSHFQTCEAVCSHIESLKLNTIIIINANYLMTVITISSQQPCKVFLCKTI